MYLTMNRFKVRKDAASDFEALWTLRDSHLKTVPGFQAFHLLKGPEADDHILYASHTAWASQEAFEAWTRSEAFRLAHKDAGGSRDMFLGPPELETYDTIQALT